MSLVLTETGGKYTPAPEGLHPAVCVDVADLGMQQTQWGLKHKVDVYWEIEEIKPKDGSPFVVRNRFTASLNEKATLRKLLEVWRGRKFTAQELRGFDLENLIGANCQVNVTHRTLDDGKTYANVTAVVPAARGQKLVPSASYVRVKDREPQPTAVPQDTTPLGDEMIDEPDFPF